jgi:hypothetical protein
MGRDMQEELIGVIGKVGELSKGKACEVLMLGRRRYYRWINWKTPLPKLSWNRIIPQEEAAIGEAGRDERLCDLRAAGADGVCPRHRQIPLQRIHCAAGIDT